MYEFLETEKGYDCSDCRVSETHFYSTAAKRKLLQTKQDSKAPKLQKVAKFNRRYDKIKRTQSSYVSHPVSSPVMSGVLTSMASSTLSQPHAETIRRGRGLVPKDIRRDMSRDRMLKTSVKTSLDKTISDYLSLNTSRLVATRGRGRGRGRGRLTGRPELAKAQQPEPKVSSSTHPPAIAYLASSYPILCCIF